MSVYCENLLLAKVKGKEYGEARKSKFYQQKKRLFGVPLCCNKKLPVKVSVRTKTKARISVKASTTFTGVQG